MRTNTVVKAQHASYQTRLDAYRNLWIHNTENTLQNVSPKNLNCKLNDYEHVTIAKAFEQALGIERIKELDAEKAYLTTNFVLSSEGVLLEVEFVTAVIASLTVNEIEALEKALKQNVAFSITWLDDNEADFVTMSTGLPYATILSICLGPNIPEGAQLGKFSTTVSIQPPLPDLNLLR